MKFLEQHYTEAIAEWRELDQSGRPLFFVGAATCGRAAGAGDVLQCLEEELAALKLDAKVIEVGCLGPCYLEPLVIVHKPGAPRICYGNVGPAEIKEILHKHVLGGDPCKQWALGRMDDGEANGIPSLHEHPVMYRQVRRIFSNCGIIDPANLKHYLARDGYRGFLRALEIGPEAVLEEVKNSGLRGRGGAGFPTFKKWEFCRNTPAEKRYLICNCSEGDPGSFMNRTLIEGDPHAVLEGMLIAGYAMNATAGYIYCGVEYVAVQKRLKLAIQQMRDAGLLGENIAGSGFSFDIILKRGAGAYVCGEETALIAAIESRRGMPRPRPPFPAVSGLWGYPTNIQNVETLGNLPLILRKGAAWYTECGSPNNKGTRSFAMAGSVKHPGLIEVPLGMPLLDIIYDVGGGAPLGRPLKAVQTGGPSGGCVPAWRFDLPVEYEALAEAGSIMGSGGMIVLDNQTCIVDLVRYFLTFTQNESCGKCPPCRVGTRAMLALVTRIAEGQGTMDDLATLESIAHTVKNGSLCGLGQTAANPVICTLRYFREEYETHIVEKRCPAGVCPALTRTPCMSGCPAGVYIPGFVSLVGEKRYAEAMRVHRERNPFASVCAYVCSHPCENRCQRAAIDAPVSIKNIKQYLVGRETAVEAPVVRENAANAARKVAVIGAGPAGLTCAYFLARLGYKPVIFEADAMPGGMLLQGIPAFRLPREELQQEIDMILGLGVTLKTNQRLGRDFTLKSLREDGFDAVMVSCGASKSAQMHIPGEEAEGVVDASAFLSTANAGGNGMTVGRRVVVVGGSNAAVDAARMARRLGAEEVTVLYRRTRREIPAYAELLEAADREDVRLYPLAAPVEVTVENGRVSGLKCARTELGAFDITGRRLPKPMPEATFDIEADQVIVAVGRRPAIAESCEDIDIGINDAGYIHADPHTQQCNPAWLFAGGEAVTGPNEIIEAIASGERAAVGIDRFLSGETHAFWRDQPLVDTAFDPARAPLTTPRFVLDEKAVERLQDSFEEFTPPFSEEVAVGQALRCLRCDYCREHQ
jgi:NADH-quinone oxidoreductase subunit F